MKFFSRFANPEFNRRNPRNIRTDLNNFPPLIKRSIKQTYIQSGRPILVSSRVKVGRSFLVKHNCISESVGFIEIKSTANERVKNRSKKIYVFFLLLLLLAEREGRICGKHDKTRENFPLSRSSLSANKINALDEPRLARETHFSR